MKRSAALTPLSRDHHHGLFAALGLTRATEETAAQAAGAFLEFWQPEGRRHVQIEEARLLPGFARHGAAERA